MMYWMRGVVVSALARLLFYMVRRRMLSMVWEQATMHSIF